MSNPIRNPQKVISAFGRECIAWVASMGCTETDHFFLPNLMTEHLCRDYDQLESDINLFESVGQLAKTRFRLAVIASSSVEVQCF